MSWCKKAAHALEDSPMFTRTCLGPSTRHVAYQKHKWCVVCLSSRHEAKPPRVPAGRMPCLPKMAGFSAFKCCTHCGACHHKLLSCTDQATAAKMAKEPMMMAASTCVVGTSQPRPVQMLAQKIETSTGEELITFWDSGT
jgi:hypothetical protein